ncbi:MAG: DUF4832 domain-containing protein [Spirochaetes bacterium]|nr:DUF4832 domain-containing protein [Spirochaetota bacterium]
MRWRPRASSTPLLNPGMGILLIQRGANKKRFDALAPDRWFLQERLSDKILLDIPWSRLEPREGEYRWDHPDWDPVIDSWRQAGFRVALQVRGMSSLGTLYDDGTPQWVFDAGARAIDHGAEFYKTFGTRRAQDDRPIRHPVYWDKVYLEKACRFIEAFGRRYEGEPWLEFVMPGHLGMWGEMHCCLHPDPEPWIRAGFSVPTYTAAFKTLLDAYRSAFPSTPLVQETGAPSYVIPGVSARDSSACIAYAVSKGVGLKMNGFGMHDPSWKDPFCHDWVAEAYDAYYPKVKVAHENYGILLDPKAFASVERHHASYWNRGGEAEGLAEEHLLGDKLFTDFDNALIQRMDVEARKEMYRHIARSIGYRFTLEEARYPEALGAGERLELSCRWVNRGAAPCYENFDLLLALHDLSGRVVWEAAQVPRFETSSLAWDRGRTHEDVSRWDLPASLPPGRYGMSLALCRRGESAVRIELGMEGGMPGNRYGLGGLRVGPGC